MVSCVGEKKNRGSYIELIFLRNRCRCFVLEIISNIIQVTFNEKISPSLFEKKRIYVDFKAPSSNEEYCKAKRN